MKVEDVKAFLMRGYVCRLDKKGQLVDDAAEKHIDKAAAWLVKGKKDSLFINGVVGTGKTTLARTICAFLEFGQFVPSVRSVTAIDLARWAEKDYGLYEEAKKSPFLFVDDFGTENLTIKSYGTDVMPVIELVYHRYDNELPSLFTSNRKFDMLGQLYGERVADRMLETFDVLSFTNSSYRR